MTGLLGESFEDIGEGKRFLIKQLLQRFEGAEKRIAEGKDQREQKLGEKVKSTVNRGRKNQYTDKRSP